MEQNRQAALAEAKQLEVDDLRAQVSELEDLLATSSSHSTHVAQEQVSAAGLASDAVPGNPEAVQERPGALEVCNTPQLVAAVLAFAARTSWG